MPKKKKAADTLEETLNVMFGSGTAQLLGNVAPELPAEKFVSTGIYSIDRLLGGGFKRGMISEVYGAEGSGKTTLCLQTAAQATKAGERVIFIDCEMALNTDYCHSLGVDPDLFVHVQPSSGEEVFGIIRETLRTAEDFNTGLIIVDSVAAMSPESDEETSQMASHARMMSKGMRNLVKHLGGNTSILMINQERAKVGVMFGSNKTTTGGAALKYQAACRLSMVRVGSVKVGDDIIGQRVKCKTLKNKFQSPYQSKEVELIYGDGFDYLSDIIEICIAKGIITKAGGWFSIPSEDKSLQGKNSLKQYYKDNPDHFSKLIEEIENG